MKPEFTIHEWRLIAIALTKVKNLSVNDRDNAKLMAHKITNYTGQFDKEGNPK